MLGRSNLALQTHKRTQSPCHWMPCITSSPGHFSAGVAGRSKRRGRARVLRGVSKWSSGAVCPPGMQDTMRTKHLLYLSCFIYTIYIYVVNRRILSCKIKRIFEDVIVKQHICGNKCRTNSAEDWGWTSHAGFAGKPNPVCVVLTPCQPTKTYWGIKWHQSSSIKGFSSKAFGWKPYAPTVPSCSITSMSSDVRRRESILSSLRRAGKLLEVMIRMQLWFRLQCRDDMVKPN